MMAVEQVRCPPAWLSYTGSAQEAARALARASCRRVAHWHPLDFVACVLPLLTESPTPSYTATAGGLPDVLEP